MGPLHKKNKPKKNHNTTTNFSFPLLSNKDKFSRHLSNKVGGEERAPSLPHRNADPGSLEAGLQLRSPAVGAEAEQGEEGRRRCHSRAPGPVATPAGPWGGRNLQAPGPAAPGEEGADCLGLPHPARSPGTQEPGPRRVARTCRPARRPSGPFAQRPPARRTHSFSRS